MEQELYSVIACVDAVSSSYLDGVRLLGNIQAKRKAAKEPIDSAAQELQQSLQQGESSVRTQYDRCFRRFGNSMAMGDRKFHPIAPTPRVGNLADDNLTVRGCKGCVEGYPHSPSATGHRQSRDP